MGVRIGAGEGASNGASIRDVGVSTGTDPDDNCGTIPVDGEGVTMLPSRAAAPADDTMINRFVPVIFTSSETIGKETDALVTLPGAEVAPLTEHIADVPSCSNESDVNCVRRPLTATTTSSLGPPSY